MKSCLYSVVLLVGCLGAAGTSFGNSDASSTSNAPSASTVSAYGMEIPASHPRLWWNQSRLVQAKKWYKAHSFTPKSDDHLGQAFVYSVTGKAGYCQDPIRHAMKVTVDTSKVSSDTARWEGENVILIYDWCYDQFTQLQRDTLIQNWNRWLAALMQKPWGGPTMPGTNYFWGYLRNELEWGIATYTENTAANSFLQDALVTRWQQAFLPYALSTGLGGIPQEGTQYGRYLIRYPVVPFLSASLLGRNLYDESDFFKQAVFYLIYSTTPATTTVVSNPASESYELFPFNDDEFYRQGGSAETSAFGDFMLIAANYWSGSPLGQYARAWVNKVHPAETPYVSAVDSGGPAAQLESLPLDYYASGPHYLYARSSWEPTATALMVQMRGLVLGSGHFHLDYGNWQLWRGGRWLSRETTGYSEPFTGYAGVGSVGAAATLAHNCILMNGVGLPIGPVNGSPVVRRLESRPAYTYTDVDLSASYRNNLAGADHPERDNPAAAHVEREFLFIRSLETLVIFDRLESNKVGSAGADQIVKTFLAHFEKKPAIDDGNHVTAKNGHQALHLSTLLPSKVSYRVVDERTAGSAVGQYRLEVDSAGSAQSYFLTVLQGRGSSDSDLLASVSETDTSYVVTLTQPRNTVTIVFNKGMVSSGGSVTVGDKQFDLISGVQETRVTDNGPVWK